MLFVKDAYSLGNMLRSQPSTKLQYKSLSFSGCRTNHQPISPRVSLRGVHQIISLARRPLENPPNGGWRQHGMAGTFGRQIPLTFTVLVVGHALYKDREFIAIISLV